MSDDMTGNHCAVSEMYVILILISYYTVMQRKPLSSEANMLTEWKALSRLSVQTSCLPSNPNVIIIGDLNCQDVHGSRPCIQQKAHYPPTHYIKPLSPDIFPQCT